ncbi:hypothetical protein tpqmel_0544 [Candidatus Gastranaerophilus sp. (ex Termes propinquus)]|nr:hypothetical protein tpqmel_0544 [Candidatus Gastranaerophilus sp. (ex Termes propinquus)]
MAHFLEHLFFKGTEKNPPGVFDRVLESKGANTNAGTSKDFTHYYITIPSKHFDTALELHADMLTNPMIPRKELEKERSVVLEEIAKNLDSPSSVMFENLFRAIYSPSKHPYMRPVIGYSDVISTISRDEILDFYTKNYYPQNMITVIVGDVEPNYAVERVSELFGANVPAAMQPKKVYPKILPIQGQVRVTEGKDINIGHMAIAFKAPKFGAKDGYALDVLTTILGDSKSSKLNQVLKEQKQLVHTISAGYSDFLDDGIITVSSTFDPENIKRVEEAIFKELELVKKGGIVEADVKKAQNMIETSTYYSRESISNISNEMGYFALYSGGVSYYDNYLQNIKKVTLKDVLRVANKYLDPKNFAVSTVLPNDFNSDDNIKEISATKPKEHGARILEQNEYVTKYELDSGAVLIIRKNTVNSIIAVNIAAKGGKHLEKVISSASLAADTAMEGTKKHTGKEFAEMLDEKGIKLGLSAGNDIFSVSLQTTKNELPSALGLLDEIVNEPLFAPSDIERIKKDKFAALKRLKDSPMSLGLDSFKGVAFKGSIYGYNADVYEKNLPLVSREDILSYYNLIFEPKNLVISVVGDVNDEEMINKFSEIFKSRGAKKLNLQDFAQSNFIPTQNMANTITKPDVQAAWVFLGFKTGSIYDDKDIATLKVMNAVLGEGMSSRLFKNLRIEQGLAYTVGSTTLQNVLDGVFVTYIGTNNKNIDTAVQGMLGELQTLRTEFVSQTELEEAKDKILGNLLISLETNMDEAALSSWYGAVGRDINYLEKYKNDIQNVTQSDILRVANKFFARPYILEVVKAP